MTSNYNFKTQMDLLADAINAKAGSSGTMTVSEMKTKVDGISSGGGISGGYGVAFSVEGSDYAFVSVQPGASISAPPVPSVTGKYFTGWYTAESGGTLVSFPYTPSGDVTFYARLVTQTVIGFTGLAGSSGELTYTDDIAACSGYSTSLDGTLVNASNGDLDQFFPFSQIAEMTDADNNVFVKFPKIWIKWVFDASGNIDGVKISNVQADQDYFIPDCFLDPADTTYNSYLDYFALGKYKATGTTSKITSKSGLTPVVSCTRATFRSAARAYGYSSNRYKGYQLIDYSMYVVYSLLCAMYFKTSNIQTVYGGRTSRGTHNNWTSASTTGTCDGLAGKNGWNTLTDCVKLLGVENPYGDLGTYLDGVYMSGQSVYIHRLPTEFSDTVSPNVTFEYQRPTVSDYIKYMKCGASPATRSYILPTAVEGASDTTYVGDKYYYNASGVVVFICGSWSTLAAAGLWYFNTTYQVNGSTQYVGARLAYRPTGV